jgi:hypothetical protein
MISRRRAAPSNPGARHPMSLRRKVSSAAVNPGWSSNATASFFQSLATDSSASRFLRNVGAISVSQAKPLRPSNSAAFSAAVALRLGSGELKAAKCSSSRLRSNGRKAMPATVLSKSNSFHCLDCAIDGAGPCLATQPPSRFLPGHVLRGQRGLRGHFSPSPLQIFEFHLNPSQKKLVFRPRRQPKMPPLPPLPPQITSRRPKRRRLWSARRSLSAVSRSARKTAQAHPPSLSGACRPRLS